MYTFHAMSVQSQPLTTQSLLAPKVPQKVSGAVLFMSRGQNTTTITLSKVVLLPKATITKKLFYRKTSN